MGEPESHLVKEFSLSFPLDVPDDGVEENRGKEVFTYM